MSHTEISQRQNLQILAKKLYIAWMYLFLHVKALIVGFFQAHRFGLARNLKDGIRDHRSENQKSPRLTSEALKRITRAFALAKSEQASAEKPYRVGKMWQDIMELEWKELLNAIAADDFDTLSSHLENFNRSSFSRATGGGYGDYNAFRKNPRLYPYLFNYIWCRYREICNRKNIQVQDLSWPLTGNPVGVMVEGQVLPHDTFRHFYYANEFAGLLKNIDHPVICEIGGGIGGLAYATRKTFQSGMTYILVDLPESLVVSSYFLQMSFPDERFLHLGEEDISQVNLRDYGFVLLPNHALPALNDRAVDLCFNANSFSEMNAETASRYVTDIDRICDRYFMHVNHDARFDWTGDDGEQIYNLIGSEIKPDPQLFRRVRKSKREFRSVQDEIFYLKHEADHHVYLFERS